MNISRILPAAVPAALALGACGSGASSANAVDAAADVLVVQPPSDAGSAPDVSEAATVPASTTLRIANLSPDIGDIDLCYRVDGSGEWQGPLLASASDAGAGDAGAALGFAEVSGYLMIMGSGAFDVAVVSAGDASCGRPRALGQVTLDAGKRATVAVMGRAAADAGSASAMTVVAFVDDPATDPTDARVRMIHAALGAQSSPPLSGIAVAVVTTSATLTFFPDIEPAHAAAPASAPPVDSLGYHVTTPLGGLAAVSVTPASDAGSFYFTTSMANLGLTPASLHTGFVVSDPAVGIGVLFCDDESQGATTVCTYLAAP